MLTEISRTLALEKLKKFHASKLNTINLSVKIENSPDTFFKFRRSFGPSLVLL